MIARFARVVGGVLLALLCVVWADAASFAATVAPASAECKSPTDQSLDVSWAAANGAQGYEYRVNGGSPMNVGSALLVRAMRLQPDTEYTVEVRAKHATLGDSAWVQAARCQTMGPAKVLEASPPPLVNAEGARVVALSTEQMGVVLLAACMASLSLGVLFVRSLRGA